MVKEELAERLEEFLTELRYQEKAENTLKKYRCNIQGFIDYLEPGRQITKDTTLAYKAHLMENGYKTSTVNNYIVSINKYLKWAGCKDLIVKVVKQQNKNCLEDVLSPADFKRLLRKAKEAGRMDIYYIMKVLAYTGIRISELEYFTVDNIQSNYINVNNKGKERVIVIRQDLARELRKYCRENKIKSGYIFPGQDPEKMISESTIWRQMKKIGGNARVKLDKVHAHSFRHLFAKVFLTEYDGNITELADILGHNSLETTRIYTRTTAQEKRQKMEKMRF